MTEQGSVTKVSDLPTWIVFQVAAKERGCTEAVVREWDPQQVVVEHSHPFTAEALIVKGEMWLGRAGRVDHLLPGDTFVLVAGERHDERYGPVGATYWVARTSTADA